MKGATTISTQRSVFRTLTPLIGSFSVSTASNFSSHTIPEAENEMLTINKMQIIGERSSFKYFRSFLNSPISCNKIISNNLIPLCKATHIPCRMQCKLRNVGMGCCNLYNKLHHSIISNFGSFLPA